MEKEPIYNTTDEQPDTPSDFWFCFFMVVIMVVVYFVGYELGGQAAERKAAARLDECKARITQILEDVKDAQR